MFINLLSLFRKNEEDSESHKSIEVFGYKMDDELSSKNNYLYVNEECKTVLFIFDGMDAKYLDNIFEHMNLLLHFYKLCEDIENVSTYLFERGKQVRHLIRKGRKKYDGYQIYMCGNSLGGYYANMYSKSKKEIIYTYNSVFIDNEQHSSSKHFRVSTDISSLLTLTPIFGGDIQMLHRKDMFTWLLENRYNVFEFVKNSHYVSSVENCEDKECIIEIPVKSE